MLRRIGTERSFPDADDVSISQLIERIGLFSDGENDTLDGDAGNSLLHSTRDPMKSSSRRTGGINESDSNQTSLPKKSVESQNSQMNEEARVLGSAPEPVGVEFDGDREHHCWPERELFKNTQDF